MNFDIDTLKERLAGDRDLIRTLLDDARGQVPEDLDRLGTFLDAGQTIEALHQAHRLKGIALNLCFPQVADISAAMEEALRSAPPGGGMDAALSGLLADLRAAWVAVEVEIKPLS